MGVAVGGGGGTVVGGAVVGVIVVGVTVVGWQRSSEVAEKQ